ncbi:trimethylamine methyltransferase family protein [Desulfitibacter alkalitolerans]|uniref:trimethylamine methyltransferase family protein n=1 Tax=Desulfitibacter alkalitolerans TaxID=264641 RepID=UPI000489B3C4|nr:trimethylamine methyltransferase family protein [Desulfitibacter alkalitolerans]
MNLASQVKVLSQDEMHMVHEKALELLKKRGIVFQTDEAIETFRKHGARIEDHTVFMDNKLVEKSLAQCPKTFRLEALNSKNSVTVGEGLLIHPAGGEVFISDHEGNRRAPTLKDFSDLQKIYQACENINIAGFQPLSPMDVNERVKGLYCVLSSMQHSDKPILSPMELVTITQKEECLKLFEIAYGQEGYLDNHYVTWHAVCSNSPFFYSDFACEGIKVYAEHNQPIIIVSAPMTGITSPIYMYSTVILTVAESLAGLVYAQLIKPGVPVVPSASLTYGNMRFATWECASPDTALMLGATIQMFKDFYHLPARAQTGVTSSKIIDYQAGMETMQSFLFSTLAGVNLTSQSVGTLANLMASSLEKTVLDDELIARVRYIINGMNTDMESMAMDDLLSAKPCQDFLTCESTLMHFRGGWQPTVSDWRSYDAWEKSGQQDVVETARQKVRQMLMNAPESLLDAEQEKAMKDYIAKIESRV